MITGKTSRQDLLPSIRKCGFFKIFTPRRQSEKLLSCAFFYHPLNFMKILELALTVAEKQVLIRKFEDFSNILTRRRTNKHAVFLALA